jgi:hypothetical protein
VGRDRRLPRWRDGGDELALDRESACSTTCAATPWRSSPATRATPASAGCARVRELHERALGERGFVAPARRRRGAARRARGPPRRPRTERKWSTLLVYLLGGGASYVSNDRVAVDAAGHAVSVPTIISIRHETLDRLPGLPPLPSAWRHGGCIAHAAGAGGAGTPPQRPARHPPTCTPAQIRAWLGAGETRAGRVVAVLFPEIDDGPAPRLVPLTEDDRPRASAGGAHRAGRRRTAGALAPGCRRRGAGAAGLHLPAGRLPAGRRAALLDELRYHLEARPMVGWDLSRLEGRMTLDPLPWSYDALAAEALRASTAALDLGTGGGERLATLAGAAGGTTGGDRIACPPTSTGARPTRSARHRGPGPRERRAAALRRRERRLVLSRHAGFDPAEVARVLRPAAASSPSRPIRPAATSCARRSGVSWRSPAT